MTKINKLPTAEKLRRQGNKNLFHNTVNLEMDSTQLDRILDSSVVGAILLLIATALVAAPGYLLNLWIEEQKWRRQKSEEDKKWQREEQKKEREYVRDLYQKTLVNLSILLTLLQQNQTETKEKRAKIIDDIHDWSTLLLLRHSDKVLLKCVDDFVLDPDDAETEKLRNKVLEVAQREDELFIISAPSDISDEPKEFSSRKEITVFIDESVRRECAKLGQEIAKKHKLHCFLIDMTPSQREKIFDSFLSSEFIPQEFELRIPRPEIGSRKDYINMKPWLSTLNPASAKLDEVLMAWESAYQETLKQGN